MPNKAHLYRLKNLGLPAIESIEGFADKTRISLEKIKYISYRSGHLYKVYEIPKINGKKRRIAQPNRELKAVQSWILRNILDKLSTSEHCKGFETGTSILDNAVPHVDSNYVLTVDLEDFFQSVKASSVYRIFNSIGYNKQVSSILTNICTSDGGLPQGAPTSPKLANLACAKLDSRVHGYAGQKGIVYTRYADDITLSAQTPKKIYNAKQFIGTIISDEGFAINKAKTRISGTRSQKKITGLILSENRAGIGRNKYREIRCKIHYLFVGKNKDYSHVNGLLSFTYSVDKKAYKKLYSYIKMLKNTYSDSKAGDLLVAEITKIPA
ncbi:retron St85 family RNA-directed DNA polymerase [Nitrosomonas ureae]|uniref:RNA-directed DNA polymerase n=1 Tax=Nitrosomonas ureae TaxID=44577 RepID=A0A1H9ESH6_9PROT|nr:retron St85 family RNA-directed DNA polymerase [Nitrosomonas ureae]SEQ27958.1 Retron-type reverse transcriptase [Nitrosomonas ureae]